MRRKYETHTNSALSARIAVIQRDVPHPTGTASSSTRRQLRRNNTWQRTINGNRQAVNDYVTKNKG